MQGFSYIEFLVVMALVVIAVVGGSFSLIGFIREEGPRSAIRSIAVALRDAEQRSMVQEAGKFWGVRFENLSDRSRYALGQSADAAGSSFAPVSVVYLANNLRFADPAASTIIMFDKITGNWISSLCPGSSATIAIATVSLHVYCNGKIE